MRNLSTQELIEELRYREENPTWFIRDLVAEGVDCDNEGFYSATDWMDQPTGLEANA